MLLGLIFFGNVVCAASGVGRLALELPISSSQEKEWANFLPKQFMVEELVVDADIEADIPELTALLGIPVAAMVTQEQLLQGLMRLAKKQKFARFVVEQRKTIKGLSIRIRIESAWTFARLQFRGSLLGKDRYRAHYMLEQGEVFDEKKHRASLEKIRQVLASEGYFSAILTDSFVYDPVTKSVAVTITINQNQQFVIEQVCSIVHGKEGLAEADVQLLADRTKKLLENVVMGQYYTKALLDDAARRLHDYLINKGFFSHTIEMQEATNDDGGVRLDFILNVAHKNVFEFHGNSFFSRRELLDQLLLFGKSVELIPPSLIAEELVAIYKKDGFWAVEVTWQDDGEQTFFFIKEGKRITVASVCIIGAQELDAACLVRTHFKQLVKSRYFNGDLIKQALDNLGTDYLQQGFWDFSVVGYDYVVQQDGKYQLEVTVHEGKRRFLKGVTVETGYEVEDEQGLQRYICLVEPIPFNIRLIQEQRQLLLKALQKRGRLYLRPRPEFIEQSDGMILSWKFSGPPDIVHFGDTILVGSGRIPPSLIMRELAYKKGDVWDQQKIEQSVQRLKDLKIFDVVSLAPEDLATPSVEKTLLLRSIEDTPYEVRARLGIQGVNRNIVKFNINGISYKAGGSFLYKNPFNKGDLFRFDVDFSRFMHDIIASYSIPWLFNQPIRTEFKGYSTRYDQPVVIGSADVLYRAAQDGGLIGFTGSYRSVDLSLNVGAEWMGIDPAELLPVVQRERALSRAIQLDVGLIGKRFPYVFIEPTVFYSTQDNKIQPTRGTLSLLTLKGMFPPTLSDAAFIKIILEQSWFIPLADSLVLALRGRCGTIFNAPIKRVMPIERFFLGGAYSVRSYEPDLVPPLNPFLDASGRVRLVPIGGKSMVNANLELRFPVYGSVSGVTFLDFGALSQNGIQAVQRADIVSAAGFGLRLNTVVGPIRFDIGWKLNKPASIRGFKDRSFAWFLSLGNAF